MDFEFTDCGKESSGWGLGCVKTAEEEQKRREGSGRGEGEEIRWGGVIYSEWRRGFSFRLGRPIAQTQSAPVE